MTDKFGDTLLAGISGRFNINKIDAGENEGNYTVTFNHSDGDVSTIMMSDDKVPCEVFLAGVHYATAKINRWVEKGDIVIANTASSYDPADEVIASEDLPDAAPSPQSKPSALDIFLGELGNEKS